MKKILKYIAAAVFASTTLVSCNLDLFPEATRVLDKSEPYWGLASDVKQSEDAIYAYFRSTCGGSRYYLSDLMLNGFNATIDFSNRLGDIHRTDDSFTASSQDIESYWGAFYIAINQYNIIIAAADDKRVQESDYKDFAQFVKAEALVARAYSYIQLARLFGTAYNETTASEDLCVPLVTVYDQNARPERASVRAVYQQIHDDLADARVIFESEASAEWLADNEPSALYFTTDVISVLQARMLLDTKQYAEAADTAAAIIGRRTYSLSADAESLIALYSEDKGTEAIMQCFASQDEAPNDYSVFTGYRQDDGSANGYAYQPDFLPSKVLLSSYDANDLRRLCWFELTGTGANTAPIYASGAYHTQINLFSKYKGNTALSSTGLPTGRVASKPFLISEMYLIAAEGYHNAGNASQANRFLQQLQSARKSGTSAANDANIGKEWFRETIGEGLYFHYLKRHGEGFSGREAQDRANNENIVVNLNDSDSYQHKEMTGSDRAFCWPIPTYEKQCNPNLVQNPGYGK